MVTKRNIPLPNSGTADGISPTTAKLVDNLNENLREYYNLIATSNMNFFKKRFMMMKTSLQRDLLGGLSDISKGSNVNFFYKMDESLKQANGNLLQITDELRMGRTDAQKLADKNEVKHEEEKREGKSIGEMLKQFLTNTRDRGEKVKGKFGTGFGKGVDLGALLDPSLANVMLGNMLTGFMGKLVGALASALTLGLGLLTSAGSAGVLGGLSIGLYDAFNAVVKAQDWGVSKAAAALGGFIAGSDRIVRASLLTSFGTWKNVAKWGLMGMGAGAVGGPLGMLAGGLIGAVFGLVMSYIGPERIAAFIQKTGDGLKKMSDAFFGTNFYDADTIKSRLQQIEDSISAHKTQIEENLKQIGILIPQHQEAIAKGDYILAEKLSAQIKSLEDMNKDIQADDKQARIDLEVYKNDLKTVQDGHSNSMKEYFKSWFFVTEEQIKEAEEKEAANKKWVAEFDAKWAKKFKDGKDYIVEGFWNLWDKITRAFSGIGDRIWNAIKGVAWEKMRGNSITEAIYSGMFGDAPASVTLENGMRDDRVSGTLSKPMGEDLVGAAATYAIRGTASVIDALTPRPGTSPNIGRGSTASAVSQSFSRIEAQKRAHDALLQMNIAPQTIVTQDNRQNLNTNVTNSIVSSPYSRQGLFTRTMNGGGGY